MEETSLVGIVGALESKRGGKGSASRQACLDRADGEEIVFIDGHDDAILGLAEVDGDLRVVYDRDAIIRELVRRDGMDRDGAIEFFGYNVADAFIGAPGPLFLARIRSKRA